MFDAETKLYYLQSRYYDPELGRFINADVLVSTGQGVLGNNMFAYCGNNPVKYSDHSGQLYTPAELHDFVVDHICKNNPHKEENETYMKFKKAVKGRKGKTQTYGYCDFYDTKTMEIWEVKRIGSVSPTKAVAQLVNYVSNGLLTGHENNQYYLGGTYTLIEADWFTVQDKDGEGTYIFVYWDAGFFDATQGIIYYDYWYIPSSGEVLTTAAIIGLAALLWGTCGLPLGTLVGAGALCPA